MSKAAWSLILFLLLIPVPVFASGEFSELNGKLLLHAGDKAYRLRLTTKPWQLIDSAWQVREQIVFDDTLFLIGRSSGQEVLFESKNGLRTTAVESIQGLETINSRVIGGKLFVVGTINSSTKLWVYDRSGFIDISQNTLTFPNELDRLAVVNEKIYLFLQSGTEMSLFGWENGWQVIDTRSCQTSAILHVMRPLIACGDKVLSVIEEKLTDFIDETIVFEGKSQSIIVLRSLTNAQKYYIISDTQTKLVLLGGSELPTATRVIGERVFLTIGGIDYELDWNKADPELFSLPTPTPSYVYDQANTIIFLSSSGQNWSSSLPNNWQVISAATSYNVALKVSGGWILFQRDGSNIQFSDDGKIFKVSNGSWSVNSKIKEVYQYNDEYYVYLLNASQNPNLYQTTDFSSWARMTLPTKPTYSLPIIQARGLPTGALAELEGSVTVLSGEAGAELVYLSDQTGGIQLFLSSEKGQVTAHRFDTAIATGEISTSQTKRLTLGDAADFILSGNKVQVPYRTTPSIAAAQDLGSRYLLVGTPSEVATNDFTLSDGTGGMKIHLPSAKTLLSNISKISLVAVVDWNASSSKNEAWFTNEELSLSPAVSSDVEVVADSKSKAKGAAVRNASSSTPRVLQSHVVSRVDSQSVPTLVSGDAIQKPSLRKELPYPVLTIFSVIAVLLAVRGRKFRMYFFED